MFIIKFIFRILEIVFYISFYLGVYMIICDGYFYKYVWFDLDLLK